MWKEITETQGLYSVSELGEVRNNRTGALLKPYLRSSGYIVYTMRMKSKGLKDVTRLAHRLVAKAFVPNPNDYLIVNHKDENKSNNAADNLEWCTASYNSTYGNATKHKVAHRYGNDISEKIVQQYDRHGNLIAEYPTIRLASQKLGINLGNISACCLGYRKTAGNYIWKFNFIKEEK